MPPFQSKYAFDALLRALNPKTVCDVGSCDGEMSVRFKRVVPKARVVAFEANPANYARIVAKDSVRRAGIEVISKAVADHSGAVTFYILEERADKEWSMGASSLKQRTNEMNPGLEETATTVDAVRLDEFLAGDPGPIALWIDVEGAAREVVEGLRGVAARVAVVHIEVETRELWVGQQSGDEVIAALEGMGFRVIGRGREWNLQENVVLVRGDAGAGTSARVKLAVAAAEGFSRARSLARRRQATTAG